VVAGAPTDMREGLSHEADVCSAIAIRVRTAAIELGLADRIELEYAEVVPGRENAAFAEAVNPLRKISASSWMTT
jgi:hypothetical protein